MIDIKQLLLDMLILTEQEVLELVLDPEETVMTKVLVAVEVHSSMLNLVLLLILQCSLKEY